jgi:hypothetical protein
MEAVRLTDGKECQALEKHEIIALIDLLCERPLADRQAEPAAELQAFCREAAIALSQANDASTSREPDTIADVDRYTAALATLLSGSDVETARRTVAEATLRSAALRLDAESALAFVDAIEQSPQTAPADLVEEMLAADRAKRPDSVPREGAGASALWSLIAGGSWSARRWRMATACMVLLVAGVASWSAYWQQTVPTAGDSVLPVAKKISEPRSVANAPAPPPSPAPAVATTQATQPCEPRSEANETRNTEISAPVEAPKASPSAGVDCSSAPGHQIADRPAGENEAMAARQQAEAARQAASARAAAEAAGKVGAAQAGRAPIQADRSRPMSGTGEHRPAATLSAPAAAPAAARPAAPAGMK